MTYYHLTYYHFNTSDINTINWQPFLDPLSPLLRDIGQWLDVNGMNISDSEENITFRSDTKVVCSQLGLPTLEHRRLTSTLLQVHRCTVILLRTYHTNLYLKILFANYPTTRGATNLHLKNPRTNAYKSTFEYFGATQFSKLPEHIKSMKTDAAFQKAICSLFI